MTPDQRLLTDPTISPQDTLEDLHWRKRATPDQGKRADLLTERWYRERDAAAECSQVLAALVEDRRP